MKGPGMRKVGGGVGFGLDEWDTVGLGLNTVRRVRTGEGEREGSVNTGAFSRFGVVFVVSSTGEEGWTSGSAYTANGSSSFSYRRLCWNDEEADAFPSEGAENELDEEPLL